MIEANLLFSFIYKELKTNFVFKYHLLTKFFFDTLQILIFYYISKIVFFVDYFSFVFCGLIFSKILKFSLLTLSEEIKTYQFQNTIETLFMLPYEESVILFNIYLSKLFFLLVEISMFSVLGFILGAKINLTKLVFILIYSFIVALISFYICLLASCLSLMVKKSENFLFVILPLIEILSGVYFSHKLLPSSLVFIYKTLPTTYLLTFFRDFILKDTIDFSLVIYPLAFFMFSYLTARKLFRTTLERVLKAGKLINY